jgi:inhibitor of growth protein 3
MAPRASTSTTHSNIHTAYSLSILSEYIHLLDSFPLELSRKFADLRELDAVISSHMNSITHKINTLTQMIEESSLNNNNDGAPTTTSSDSPPSKQDRLLLLSEIAEEAGRLKLGGEDKIRIACSAADILKSHFGHMRALLEHLPGFDVSVLRRRTTYPHISPRSYMPPGGIETGRRRRGGYGSLLTGSVESPAKRKRANREDDVEERGVNGRSPNKKDRNGDHSQRNRNASRAKKCVLLISVFFND